ncbi:hypothetical protein NIES3974_48450 [Calothrix sp. NIES-3974]|nr:hypothetical protein NIES3974_48450 [Calothrix sp. NIES-3974]
MCNHSGCLPDLEVGISTNYLFSPGYHRKFNIRNSGAGIGIYQQNPKFQIQNLESHWFLSSAMVDVNLENRLAKINHRNKPPQLNIPLVQ